MAYVFPLLIFSGLTGGLVLLGLGSITRLRGVRKPVTAAWLLLQALLWFVLPQSGRWVMSTWSPGSILNGWLILDVTPEIWWLGFILALVLSARMWGESAERRDHIPLSGVLLLLYLTAIWISMTSGSLLMTLIAWGISDVVWCVASLMAGGNGERILIGTAVLGFSTIILWATSLFLLQDGISSIWWLVQPSPAILSLLLLTVIIRVGFYPFHIVLDDGSSEEHTIGAIYSLGPLVGIGVLFRVLNMPGIHIPNWFIVWSIVSSIWCAIRACITQERSAFLWAVYAALYLIIASSVITTSSLYLAYGLATWLGCYTMFMLARGSTQAPWSWPTWLATLFILAAPPSIMLGVYDSIFLNVSPLLNSLTFLAFLFTYIALMMALRRDYWSVKIPWATHHVSFALSYLLPLLGIAATTIQVKFTMPSTLMLILWLGVMSLAGLLFIYGGIFQKAWGRLYPVLEVFDGQWFYHAVWQGSVNILNMISVLADVIEGRGSLLWSLLILLLVIMVVTSR
jgi:hypothetical protein